MLQSQAMARYIVADGLSSQTYDEISEERLTAMGSPYYAAMTYCSIVWKTQFGPRILYSVGESGDKAAGYCGRTRKTGPDTERQTGCPGRQIGCRGIYFRLGDQKPGDKAVG
jgi:hypothetical protein